MYQKLQFIAYEINTAPSYVGFKRQYLGLPSDFNDIAARIRWTKEVLTQATAKAEKSSDTMKVFMIPEFYFRGINGAYEMGTIDLLITGLQNLVSGAEWKDWLFIFGSMIGTAAATKDAEELATTGNLHDDPAVGTAIDPEAQREVYNVALVQKGGWSANSSVALDKMTPDQRNTALDGTTFATMKEYKSPVDFIRIAKIQGNRGFVWERVMHLDRLGGPSSDSVVTGREERFVDYDGSCLFAMDGIQFGLEICLDHANQRLKNAPRPAGSPKVQIQLVPSCGLQLWDSAMVAMAGGYGFNVDGNFTDEDNFATSARSELRVVDTEASLLNPNATLDPNNSPRDIVPVRALPDLDNTTLYAWGTGQLSIYKAVDVPVQGSSLSSETGECRPRRR